MLVTKCPKLVRLWGKPTTIISEVEGKTSTREREMSMYVCNACVVLHYNGDYSGTDWSAERAEEIAENLSELFPYGDPHFNMRHCLGCGERGGDYYPVGYYDDDGKLVTN